MYNCVLIGYGRIGKIHYKNILENPNLILKYIYELDDRIESIQKEVNKSIKVTSRLEEIMNDKDISLSIICTPTNLHYKFIKESLNKGKHVLCEKPISNTIEEIKDCYKFAKDNDCILLCALNRRFDPKIINLKDNIDSIGSIYQIITFSRDFPYPSFEYLKISSGIFHDCGIHDIDYVNWILKSRPISVYVTGNKVYSYEKNADTLDNAVIILEYPENIICSINLSRISPNYDQRIEIYGIEGVIKVGNSYGSILSFTDEPISFPERYKESYKNELEHFLNVIEKKESLCILEEDCINGFHIVEACKKSYSTSSKITIKYTDEFRNYDNVVNSIKENYYKARVNQTVEYVENMHKKYLNFDKKMNIREILKKLDTFIDISDPDFAHPNSFHSYQTAEGIRKDGYPEWFQLVGLIHDIGKIIYLKGCDEDGTSMKEQWGIVGDTFIVGCQLPENIIFPEFNKENPDMQNSEYNSKLGIYKEACGMNNIKCSWGHDEYLYQILKFNKTNLPKEALYIIRFHSLYSYHTYDEYKYFMNDEDFNMLKWLKIFNKYDLYTKSDNLIYDENIKIYYDDLIDKFLDDGDLYI